MTLSTHAVSGGIIASVVSRLPIVGFVLAFLSHFALDAIPHWDYKLASKKKGESGPLTDDIVLNKDFVSDLLKIALDLLIGIAAIIILHYLFRFPLGSLILGGIAGALPDLLQFVYFKTRIEPFISIQKFHIWIHSKKRIMSPILGILIQAAIVSALVIVARIL